MKPPLPEAPARRPLSPAPPGRGSPDTWRLRKAPVASGKWDRKAVRVAPKPMGLWTGRKWVFGKSMPNGVSFFLSLGTAAQDHPSLVMSKAGLHARLSAGSVENKTNQGRATQ